LSVADASNVFADETWFAYETLFADEKAVVSVLRMRSFVGSCDADALENSHP
jgi:hypothetical protein